MRVLLVNDDPESGPLLRSQLGSTLESRIELDWMSNPDLALSTLLAARHDVALIDQNTGGIGLILEASLGGSTVPMILLTGEDIEGTHRFAIEAGASDTLALAHRDPRSIGRLVHRVICQGRVIAGLRAGEAKYRLLAENASDFISLHDPEGRCRYASPSSQNLLGLEPDQLIGRSAFEFIHPDDRDSVRRSLLHLIRSGGPGRMVFRLLGRDRLIWCESTCRVVRDPETRRIEEILSATRDVGERIRAEGEILRLNDQLERRLERMQTLRRIDSAIASGVDLKRTLQMVIHEVQSHLGLDAADILLLDESSRSLKSQASRGIGGLEEIWSGIEPLTWEVAEGGCSAVVPDLARVVDRFPEAGRLVSEGFVAYQAVPFAAKGKVKGVLETFHRSPMDPDPESLDFLGTLAGQAALAIDNAALFEKLRTSNAQLSMAYEATIEGWARALDLRDKETEGHSRRVTEMTVELGRQMGLDEPTLVHVRRGAQLHDIGKMGVPDAILLKPGALTDDEWVCMKRHPEYAREMIWPIEFLRPSIEIPYCHHERWDGSGYPQGLQQDEIPLVARIFAVVDIWDALSHDRPYRKAWHPSDVREHIQTLSGTHLDPQVIEAFLKMIADGTHSLENQEEIALGFDSIGPEGEFSPFSENGKRWSSPSSGSGSKVPEPLPLRGSGRIDWSLGPSLSEPGDPAKLSSRLDQRGITPARTRSLPDWRKIGIEPGGHTGRLVADP